MGGAPAPLPARREPSDGVPIIWMADTNATPNYPIDGLIGTASIRECNASSNRCGSLLNKFIKESAIILHATFLDEEMQESKKGTFAIDGDTKNLIDIDFIGTSGRIRYVHQTSRSIQIYQEREKRPDHFPRAIDVVLFPNAQTVGCTRRTAGYDRKRTADVAAVENFDHLLKQLPEIPASVEPTSHQFIMMDWLKSLTATAFPISLPIPRNPYITDDIIVKIRERNEHAHYRTWLLKCIDESDTRAVFKVWAVNRSTIAWQAAFWNSFCGFINPKHWRALQKESREIKILNKVIENVVENCKINWLSKKEEGIKVAMETGHYTHILKIITDAKPREARQQLAIKDANGSFAVTDTATQDVFRTHFRKLLVGHNDTMSNVITVDRNNQIAKFSRGQGRKNDPTQAPGKSALQSKIGCTKVKALGEDRVGAEVYKCAPKSIATNTSPPVRQAIQYRLGRHPIKRWAPICVPEGRRHQPNRGRI